MPHEIFGEEERKQILIMIQAKILTIKKEMVYSLAQFGILLSVVILAPLFFQQAITGVIVNAALFVSVIILGARNAILIAIVPSLIALSVGLLPIALAPMIPFIMAGNIILILCFGLLREKNYWLGVVMASSLKFLFLFSVSYVVMNLFIQQGVVAKATATMMGLPQLLTALAGGVIAYLFLKSYKKYWPTR